MWGAVALDPACGSSRAKGLVLVSEGAGARLERLRPPAFPFPLVFVMLVLLRWIVDWMFCYLLGFASELYTFSSPTPCSILCAPMFWGVCAPLIVALWCVVVEGVSCVETGWSWLSRERLRSDLDWAGSFLFVLACCRSNPSFGHFLLGARQPEYVSHLFVVSFHTLCVHFVRHFSSIELWF
jgi:hypothetical protein